MRTIGLIGGMSWESTMPYYRVVNETVRDRLGGLHSAKVVMYSVDFHEIAQLQKAGKWAEAGRVLAQAALSLQSIGADCIVVCTNTMHIVADAIGCAVTIPLIHIVDTTAFVIKRYGISTVGLLGTRFTMEQPFYRDRLLERFDIKVITPDEADRQIVHNVIFDELCVGRRLDCSRNAYQRIIRQLAENGAQGVLLGCTEISMLVSEDDSPIPIFDTTSIHARAAAEWALGADSAAESSCVPQAQ